MLSDSGCEPLTPDDIAEVVVFTAGRRENVVIADTLIFPNHQVSLPLAITHPYNSTPYFSTPWTAVVVTQPHRMPPL